MNSSLWLVHDGQHMLPQENPDEFNKQTLKFLKTVNSKPNPLE